MDSNVPSSDTVRNGKPPAIIGLILSYAQSLSFVIYVLTAVYIYFLVSFSTEPTRMSENALLSGLVEVEV